MKVQRKMIPELTLEEFADKYGLTMEINERDARLIERGLRRFYASFDSVEIGGGGFLKGAYGNGSTEEVALADYVSQITEQTLVVNAYRDNRVNIKPTRIIPDKLLDN